MIIGIDANEANVKNRVGSNVFAFELLWQLYKKLQIANCKLRIYLKSEPSVDLPKENDHWQYKILKPTFLWTQWRLPLDLYLSTPDLFIALGHYAPRFCPCPSLVCVMDLAFLRFPGQFRKKDLWQLKNWTNYSVGKAKHILTISEFSKEEIMRFYHYPEKQITVIYPGITQNFQPEAGRPLAEKSKVINNKYFLYIGTLQPRKNLIRLVEAFNLVTKQLNNKAIKLIIAGKKGWLYESIFQKVKELNLTDKVIFTGFVNEEEKFALLKKALCFIYPSLYEGFGIPVLEAMSVGCPVIVSRNSSLPEVAGEAALYLEKPQEIESIQQTMEKMLKLTQGERNLLIRKGYKQIGKFSWEEAGKKTMEVICSLLKTEWGKN